jgi:hypothetical protein
MNSFDLMRQALSEASETMRAADSYAWNAARLIVGRLRHVNPGILREMKRELRDFNMVTGRWETKK